MKLADEAREEAKIRAEKEEFDATVIDEAAAEHKLLTASKEGKRKRGRKETRADIYIKDSCEKIAEYAQLLEDCKETLSYEEKRLLRNKKSALENRIKTKL